MADIEALKQAVALSPDNPPLILMLGKAYLEAFQPDDARAQFDKVLSIDPQNVEAKLGLIRALDLSGRRSEAIVRAEGLCQQEPRNGAARKMLARLLLEDGDAKEARKSYDLAIKLDPSQRDGSLLRCIDEAENKANRPSSGPAVSSGNASHASAQMDPNYDPVQDRASKDDEALLDFEETANTKFKDVGGMEPVKKDIRMKILLPLKNPEMFRAYGKKAGGGVLLYGPPGCGKTLISRATAGEIDASFFSIGLHQILEMWIGNSEKNLHELFELARQRRPAVLFFDEIDALAADRKDLRTSHSRTLINQFLSELDGSINSNDEVLVLGATNAPWHLDSAFLRPGRFDRVVFVPPPDEIARKEIIEVMARNKPIVNLDLEQLVKKTADFSGADIKAMFDRAIETALEVALETGEIVPISTKELLNARKLVKPSTMKWFESAKNYALYSNQSGFYDDVLEYLGLKK